jgi:hypothetical protein
VVEPKWLEEIISIKVAKVVESHVEIDKIIV